VCIAPVDGTRAPSAGDVTVAVGGAAVPVSLPLSPDESGRYANPARPTPMWSPESPVRFVVAGGADVPAFDVTLAAPPPLHVLVPDPASTTPVALDRTAGFHARWVPSDGEVRVAVRQEASSALTAFDAGVAIDCFFDAASGGADVPPSALADLSATDANVMVYAVRRMHVAAAPYDVLVLTNTAGTFQRAQVR
jgi:hypothetical protein